MNGKELPKSSFEKYTAKSLVNKMKKANDLSLKNYLVAATDRHHNIWLRDPLAIKIFNLEMFVQKLDYIHLNPMQPHWLLCSHPAEYRGTYFLADLMTRGITGQSIGQHLDNAVGGPLKEW